MNPGFAAAHINEINALMDAVEMDVICISETWYKAAIHTSELVYPDIVLCDRIERWQQRWWYCDVYQVKSQIQSLSPLTR
jgi:hypothetical protein